MNLLARHDCREFPEMLASYQFDEIPKGTRPVKPASVGYFDKRIILPNILIDRDPATYSFLIAIIMIIAIFGGIFFVELEVFSDISVRTVGFFETYIPILFIRLPTVLFPLCLIRYACDARYLVISKGKAYLHTKRRGVWPFDLKDLKFHIIKGKTPVVRYFLEVELPEKMFMDYHRMIIVAVSARKETIEGMLAVLIPLLNGDFKPYETASERGYEIIPENENPNFWRRFRNWQANAYIWYFVDKVNEVIFWLIHGSKVKILQHYEYH